METCPSKVVQWTEVMLSKLVTFPYIYWVEWKENNVGSNRFVAQFRENSKRFTSEVRNGWERIRDFSSSGGSRIFPRGGVNPPGGAWTRQIFPKTAWNRKNLDAQGGACVPHAPPRSANVKTSNGTTFSAFLPKKSMKVWTFLRWKIEWNRLTNMKAGFVSPRIRHPPHLCMS